MNRREFLCTSAAGLALSAGRGYAEEKRRRVGIIGPGWYGKTDLFRLIQVAPVEVVSLCDVDRQMLEKAADLTATRQASGKRPRTYSDYRQMLKEKDLDIVLVATPDHWHALAMIAAVEVGRRRLRAEARQRGYPRRAGHAGRGAQASAGGTGRHSAPEYSAYRRGSRSFHQGRQAGQDWAGRNVLLLPYAGTENPPDTAPPALSRLRNVDRPGAMRPYNKLVHPRGWRAFMEYGNGIVGDMCIHMFDMVRWMLDLAGRSASLPKAAS